MQTYDMLMALVLVAATLFGFWKGMAWQIASLASLVLSYFVAKEFSDQLAPMISSHAPWNKFVAMLAIYVATSFVIWTVFRLVAGLIDRVKLDGFDHQMGAVIGLGKGVLLCIVITFFAVSILPQAQKDTIIASHAGKYIVQLLGKTHSLVPPEIHDVIHPYVERIEQRLDPAHQPSAEQGFQVQWPSLPVKWPAQQNTVDNDQPPQQTNQQSSSPVVPSWPSAEQPLQNNWTPPPVPPQTADRPVGTPY